MLGRFVPMLVVLEFGAACTSSRATHLTVASNPTAQSTTTTPAAPGKSFVSYHHVSVQVPASWPVVDGNHTPMCGPTFPDTPSAFVGPQLNARPSCPYLPHGPGRDGVWLQPGDPPGETALVVLPSGERVEESSDPQAITVWLRGVQIEVGLGPDRSVSAAIVDSVVYQPNRADTLAAGACRVERTTNMPQPERLDHPITIENGDTTLAPPEPSDEPGVPASAIWTGPDPSPSLEIYRVLLSRYSSRTPATPNGHGGWTPEFQNRLAWVIYTTSATPDVAGCGGTGVNFFDAHTGQNLGASYFGG